MKTNMNEINNISDEAFQPSSILAELFLEADAIFKSLDSISGQIRSFEEHLNDIKAFFPFRFLIEEEAETLSRALANSHEEFLRSCNIPVLSMDYVASQTSWYISWELLEEKPKRFRLFLISETKEFIYCSRRNSALEFKSETPFRKPLIETDINTRLKYATNLDPFFIAFKEYLRSCQLRSSLNF